MEQLKLAYDLYNNSIYLNHLDKIENKEVLEIFKRINNRKELYLYILDLINDNDSAYSKRLKEWVYWEMGKDYYQELINAINDYIKCVIDEDVLRRQETEWSKGYIISFNEAKNIFISKKLYHVSCLEYKLKKYDVALKSIESSISLSYLLTDTLLKQKYKVLTKIDKLKAKDYLESLNNEYKDRKFGNIDGTKKERYEYLRKMNIRFEIDKLLEKNKDS